MQWLSRLRRQRGRVVVRSSARVRASIKRLRSDWLLWLANGNEPLNRGCVRTRARSVDSYVALPVRFFFPRPLKLRVMAWARSGESYKYLADRVYCVSFGACSPEPNTC